MRFPGTGADADADADAVLAHGQWKDASERTLSAPAASEARLAVIAAYAVEVAKIAVDAGVHAGLAVDLEDVTEGIVGSVVMPVLEKVPVFEGPTDIEMTQNAAPDGAVVLAEPGFEAELRIVQLI